MSWIGLHDGTTRLWHPRGLGRPGPADSPAMLPRGALMLEAVIEAGSGGGQAPLTILRHASRDPWDSYLSLVLDGAGDLVVRQGLQGEVRNWYLALPEMNPGESLVISLQWDLAAKAGFVSVWLPDRPALRVVTAAPPLGLHRLDAERMMIDPAACRTIPGLRWLALSDRPVSPGPAAGMAGGAPVAVPGGAIAAEMLDTGDAVRLAEGGLARIAWAGWTRLPARGLYRPHLLRAPYYGLTHDFLAAADLPIRLTGSDIEYLFGQESVAVTAAQLADMRRVLRPQSPLTVRYRRFILDRPGNLLVGGAVVEPLDIDAIAPDPAIAALVAPGSSRSRAGTDHRTIRLRDYEAMTLVRMRAA